HGACERAAANIDNVADLPAGDRAGQGFRLIEYQRARGSSEDHTGCGAAGEDVLGTAIDRRVARGPTQFDDLIAAVDDRADGRAAQENVFLIATTESDSAQRLARVDEKGGHRMFS